MGFGIALALYWVGFARNVSYFENPTENLRRIT
jgi:hypothetical protein